MLPFEGFFCLGDFTLSATAVLVLLRRNKANPFVFTLMLAIVGNNRLQAGGFLLCCQLAAIGPLANFDGQF